MSNITGILKGVSGQLEWTRVFGAIGVAVYMVATLVCVGWTVFRLGKPFDVTAYCIGFPTGLGIAIAAIATAAGQKDKAVASAQTVQDTGALPATPSAKP
jgi:hypothetical protein